MHYNWGGKEEADWLVRIETNFGNPEISTTKTNYGGESLVLWSLDHELQSESIIVRNANSYHRVIIIPSFKVYTFNLHNFTHLPRP